MIGVSLSRWTMSYLAAALAALLLAQGLMAAGYGYPSAPVESPRTLIVVHVMAIGWLSLLMCGALLQFVPVLINRPLFSNSLAMPALLCLLGGLGALLLGFLWLDGQIEAVLPYFAVASYFDAKMNRHTSPQLDALVAELRADRDLKVEAQRMKHLFTANAETLLHGDLHSGSIMVTEAETRMIDPEFAFYGPMAFDVGMLLANFWMAFFSQRGHERDGDRATTRVYLIDVILETWSIFRKEFSHLWRTERTGILYQNSLFEDQGDTLGAEQALDQVLHSIWTDMLGFAGIEIHRRILGLAHNADFETIADQDLRATCEAKALKFGRQIVVNRRQIHSIEEVNALAILMEKGAAS